MHLNLKLNGCFSLGYDLTDPPDIPEGVGGTVRLNLPIDHFSALIRKGLSCRLESSFQRSRAGNVQSVQKQGNAVLLEVKLKQGPLPLNAVKPAYS